MALQHADSVEQTSYLAQKKQAEQNEIALQNIIKEREELLENERKEQERNIFEKQQANEAKKKKIVRAIIWITPIALVVLTIFYVANILSSAKYNEYLTIYNDKLNNANAELQHTKTKMSEVSKRIDDLKRGEELYAEKRVSELYHDQFSKVIFHLQKNKPGDYLLKINNNTDYFIKTLIGKIYVTEKGIAWPKTFTVSQDLARVGGEFILKPHDTQYVTDYSGDKMPVITQEDLKKELYVPKSDRYYSNVLFNAYTYASLDTSAQFTGDILFIEKTQKGNASEHFSEVDFREIARKEYKSVNDYFNNLSKLSSEYNDLEGSSKKLEQYIYTLNSNPPKKTFFGANYVAM